MSNSHEHKKEVDNEPRSIRRKKKGPNVDGTACRIMTIPHRIICAPRYLPSRNFWAIYMDGKTQIKKPRMTLFGELQYVLSYGTYFT
jgi:hypothetical protein